MVPAIRCHRQNMKTSIINGSEVSRLSVAIQRLASEQLERPLDCTFHDLKAKGISDYEGSSKDKQIFSGHKTESQVLVYDRSIKITPTLKKT